MKSRFRKLAVESLEGRSVLSTFVEADFNGDGFPDLAAITGPTTITVSLFDPADGGYDVSAILKVPKSLSMQSVDVWDLGDDGDLDILAYGVSKSAGLYEHVWLNDGDGNFGGRATQRHLWEGWF